LPAIFCDEIFNGFVVETVAAVEARVRVLGLMGTLFCIFVDFTLPGRDDAFILPLGLIFILGIGFGLFLGAIIIYYILYK